MISLSRIFKASSYQHSDEKILLSVKASLPLKTEDLGEKLQENENYLHEVQLEAQTILRDAEEMAKRILAEAVEQAELNKNQAEADIQQWAKEQRRLAEAQIDQDRQQARQEGYQQGLIEGKQQALQEEEQTVQLAKQVLEMAYAEKRTIIAEAEPFLVELSTEIARKIIGAELELDQMRKLELVSRYLRRSRVHGDISLYVNHADYPFLSEHRQQLASLFDGQAELQIFPDHTVKDEGCVIRTPLGSIDARIDTQLAEIKQALIEIARGSDADEPA